MIELGWRLIRWFVRLVGGPTLLRLLLLALTLLCVQGGVVATVGHIHPQKLGTTVLLAILTGWLLARSRLPGWKVGMSVLGIGLLWLILSVGGISVPLLKLLSAWQAYARLILLHKPLQSGPLLVAWSALAQDLGALSSRILLWVGNAGSRTLIVDPMVTSLIWGLGLWLVAAWAAWWVRRREALGLALLPATAMLVFNIYYTNSIFGILWLVLAGGGWIALQAAGNYVKARRRWQAQHIGQTEIEPLLAGVVALIAGSLMLTGGLLPSVSIQKISDTLQHIFQSHSDKTLAESLGLQQTPLAVPEARTSSGIGISDVHAVGPGPKLTQQVMLYVSVDGYVPPPPAEVLIHTSLPQPDVRYYWRSQTYDSYNGHVWVANTARTQSFPANSAYHSNLAAQPQNYQTVTAHIQRLQPVDEALFVTGDLQNADQPSIAAWRSAGDLVDARTTSDFYTAISRVQNISVVQLRHAGKNYPASVQPYLGLPDELPGRVRDLSVRLTIAQPTPYDQVMAVQNYLRQFPYSLQVPGSPTDRDVADYFLFDLQKGYCDYFATTMAVMVRAVGIPARLVTGFSSGSYDYAEHRFVVVQANSHSWVEVYFPGIGWVEFEPTTNQLPFVRPGEKTNANNPAADLPVPVSVVETTGTYFNWKVLHGPLLAAEIILSSLACLLIAWLVLPVEAWWLTWRPSGKAIPGIYQRLYRLARLWGVSADAARTPHEFAQAFMDRLERFSGNQRLIPLTTAVQADLDWLTELYTHLLFSPHTPTREQHRQAVQNWSRIRKTLRKLRNS
jgi:transglutaminase-like putative cysteine protease